MCDVENGKGRWKFIEYYLRKRNGEERFKMKGKMK
jgi:hypothetical protein